MPLIPFREYRPDVTDYAQRAPPPGGHVERSSSGSVFCERKNRLGHIEREVAEEASRKAGRKAAKENGREAYEEANYRALVIFGSSLQRRPRVKMNSIDFTNHTGNDDENARYSR